MATTDSIVKTDDNFSEVGPGRNSESVSFRHRPRLSEISDVLKKKDRIGFEYAEHGFLGDTINIQWYDGKSYVGSKLPFTLPNKLVVTYGQINGLAGDFYGTVNPISDGQTLQEQSQRFSAAWGALAIDTSRQPQEAEAILNVLQTEVDAVNAALEKHEDPSVAYANLPDQTSTFEKLTMTRGSDYPSYLGLSLINWDHFGADARTAYNAGHWTALHKAANGSPEDLHIAYTLNAFADHFLEDSFSAGHTRTPRRILHGSFGTADFCAKYMHDEDNAIGLQVKNPSGQASWTMYGDKRLLDSVDQSNCNFCQQAIQVSADEIYKAWTTRTVPDIGSFGAWEIACTLDSARGQQSLAPLFQFGDGPPRRKDIEDRKTWDFITSGYTYTGTIWDCKTSGMWKYPIHM